MKYPDIMHQTSSICLRPTFTILSDFHKQNFWTEVLFKVWFLYPIKRNTSKGRRTDIEDLKGKQSIIQSGTVDCWLNLGAKI